MLTLNDVLKKINGKVKVRYTYLNVKTQNECKYVITGDKEFVIDKCRSMLKFNVYPQNICFKKGYIEVYINEC